MSQYRASRYRDEDTYPQSPSPHRESFNDGWGNAASPLECDDGGGWGCDYSCRRCHSPASSRSSSPIPSDITSTPPLILPSVASMTTHIIHPQHTPSNATYIEREVQRQVDSLQSALLEELRETTKAQINEAVEVAVRAGRRKEEEKIWKEVMGMWNVVEGLKKECAWALRSCRLDYEARRDRLDAQYQIVYDLAELQHRQQAMIANQQTMESFRVNSWQVTPVESQYAYYQTPTVLPISALSQAELRSEFAAEKEKSARMMAGLAGEIKELKQELSALRADQEGGQRSAYQTEPASSGSENVAIIRNTKDYSRLISSLSPPANPPTIALSGMAHPFYPNAIKPQSIPPSILLDPHASPSDLAEKPGHPYLMNEAKPAEPNSNGNGGDGSRLDRNNEACVREKGSAAVVSRMGEKDKEEMAGKDGLKTPAVGINVLETAAASTIESIVNQGLAALGDVAFHSSVAISSIAQAKEDAERSLAELAICHSRKMEVMADKLDGAMLAFAELYPAHPPSGAPALNKSKVITVPPIEINNNDKPPFTALPTPSEPTLTPQPIPVHLSSSRTIAPSQGICDSICVGQSSGSSAPSLASSLKVAHAVIETRSGPLYRYLPDLGAVSGVVDREGMGVEEQEDGYIMA